MLRFPPRAKRRSMVGFAPLWWPHALDSPPALPLLHRDPAGCRAPAGGRRGRGASRPQRGRGRGGAGPGSAGGRGDEGLLRAPVRSRCAPLRSSLQARPRPDPGLQPGACPRRGRPAPRRPSAVSRAARTEAAAADSGCLREAHRPRGGRPGFAGLRPGDSDPAGLPGAGQHHRCERAGRRRGVDGRQGARRDPADARAGGCG